MARFLFIDRDAILPGLGNLKGEEKQGKRGAAPNVRPRHTQNLTATHTWGPGTLVDCTWGKSSSGSWPV